MNKIKSYLLQFGGKPTPELQDQYQESPNWKGGKFENLEETSMDIGLRELPGLLYKQFFLKNNREPKHPIPIESFDLAEFLADDEPFKFIWFGHSVILMRFHAKTILIDPMLGPDASPIAPTNISRFSKNTLELIDQFPQIDLLLLSHDHYDHLDLKSIKKLIPKTSEYYVAVGVKRHLIKWGVDSKKVTEFDWWETSYWNEITITFTPTRHFSGRGISDRAKSLWGGWCFQSKQRSIWFSGDGGYGSHFKEIGSRLDPFDFAFMECGQYNKLWHQIHMFPEEAVQAAKDANASCIMPVHWAGFALAQHPWTEPVTRFSKEAVQQQIPQAYPKIGAIHSISVDHPSDNWWEEYEN